MNKSNKFSPDVRERAVCMICKFLQIAPSGHLQRDPQQRCARGRRDDALVPQIEQSGWSIFRFYGADQIWRQLMREGMTGGALHG